MSISAVSMGLPLATGLGFAWRESGGISKLIVIVLFLGSMFAWSVMLNKGLALRGAKRGAAKFRDQHRRNKEPLSELVRRMKLPECPLYEVYLAGAKEAARHLQSGVEPTPDLFDANHVPEGRLEVAQIDRVRDAMDREINNQSLWLESYLGWLATAVSAGPLLGLLGTVWGIMDAFGAMAVKGTAAISAVAPGISGALLTTVIGLLVAIPSLIGYNVLIHQVERLTVEIENFANEFVAAVEHRYKR